MKIDITKENLKGKSLFVAIPMYGAMCNGYCMHSCLELQNLCFQLGVKIIFSFQMGESLVQRARNYCVSEFLERSDCTHMLFIDADIQFDPRDVLAMLIINKEVIGAPYPKKMINWEKIKQMIIKNPDIDVNELHTIGANFVLNLEEDTKELSITEPVEVKEIGTGFMMIERGVFKKLNDAYPEISYKPDHAEIAGFDGSIKVSAFFDCCIDKDTNRYLSEDYYFNKIWRDIGGKVWYCPWMRTAHFGNYAYVGDIPTIAKNYGQL